jgi:DHA1 family bicyclomycin/chloramphenicol resistance-like MFS transporter
MDGCGRQHAAEPSVGRPRSAALGAARPDAPGAPHAGPPPEAPATGAVGGVDPASDAERTAAARAATGIPTPLLLVLLGSLSAVGAFSLDMYLPALPRLSRDFGVDDSLAQLTLTGCLIGIAVGQLVAGPVSDVLGRRRPLAFGIVLFTVTSVACALAPSIPVLLALRVLQGLGGACGMVIGRAVVRDLFSGADAARLYSRLMLVVGVSPVLAPLAGSLVLQLTSWRGIFVVLAAFGLALLVVAVSFLDETNPPARRHRGGLRQTVGGFRTLLGDRRFVAHALGLGLSTGAVFAYLAGSPFVIQDVYGASPQLYGVLFGVNAVGLVVGSQLNARLVATVGTERLLRRGNVGMVVAAAGLLAVTPFRGLGLVSIVVPLVILLTSMGFVAANATALGLAVHPEIAGSASALLGLVQFGVGAGIAPLVGLAGDDTAVPLAVVIAALAVISPLLQAALTRSPRARA